MNISLKKWQMAILVIMIFISFSVSVLLLMDFDKPSHYNLLFILPLEFSFLLFIFARLFRDFLNNLGITLILGLLFCRLVISPFFMVLGGYADMIVMGTDTYTPVAIVLVAYETMVVMLTMFVLMKDKSLEGYGLNDNSIFALNKKYCRLLFLLVVIQTIVFLYTPGLLEGYRTIFDIGDETFTHLEQTYIINKHATNFTNKLSLVTGSYLMNILRLLLPGAIIIWINRGKRNKLRLLMSYAIAITPFFMIDGAIARSIIYSLILFMIVRYLYPQKGMKQIAKVLVVSSFAVIVFWVIRFNITGNTDIFRYFALKFSTYFSGINIVAGSFNLPRDLDIRLHYFTYDLLKAIPFSNTLFSLESGDIATYFNYINGTWGQIPTTIGSGYYYFGFLFAPIYSIIFTIMAFKMGAQVNRSSNYISKIRYLFLAITFPMGIVMYNIPITLIRLFTVALPMYLLEIIAYGSSKRNGRECRAAKLKIADTTRVW